MEKKPVETFRINKVYVASLCTLCVSAIGSAAVAIVDVAVLKAKVDIYVEDQKEIKEDIREIKRDIKDFLKALPKEG